MKTERGKGNGMIVLTTTEKEEEAEKLCSALLAKKLAGCVQIIGPIKSRYWWEGKIETSTEFLCIIKTCKDRYQEVEKEIKANHPYSVPEIVGVEMKKVSRDYIEWLQKIVLRE